MSPRNKTLAWLLGLLGLAVLAFVAGRHYLAPPPADVAETPAEEEVLPPWDFEWRDGDVRGIDLPSHVRVGDQRVPIRHLADLQSEPGEDKLAFLLRVRTHLVDFSHATRREGCAEICQAPDGSYSVRMTTNDAALYCTVAPICQAGHASTGEGIHSHCPRRNGIRASLADEVLSGGKIRRRQPIASCDTDVFSALDFRGRRPGWLAGRLALHMHEGPQKLQRFGEPINEASAPTAP
ncbi:hypothetical protein [Arenimonas caeni]|jgi:hypothetical protein|uniref:Uncharacterized protein n=1 Tax=Arenimonas caeni TaxID=2058085 RepID=A0A2P6MBN7_9GAMM|nr:hypothetical protein [Arenimonas caeni]PRH83390.1 hypothetical protein C6N40_01700 [Arenimonas caeni]